MFFENLESVLLFRGRAALQGRRKPPRTTKALASVFFLLDATHPQL